MESNRDGRNERENSTTTRDRQWPTSPSEKQQRKFDDGDAISDSSSTRNNCSHGQIFKMNYINVDIPDFKEKNTTRWVYKFASNNWMHIRVQWDIMREKGKLLILQWI